MVSNTDCQNPRVSSICCNFHLFFKSLLSSNNDHFPNSPSSPRISHETVPKLFRQERFCLSHSSPQNNLLSSIPISRALIRMFLDAPSHLYKRVHPSVGPERLLSDACETHLMPSIRPCIKYFLKYISSVIIKKSVRT